MISRSQAVLRPACKPRSVLPEGMDDHLSKRSTRDSTRRAVFHPCLTLLLAGVTWPRTLLPAPVVSYTTFSPSPFRLFVSVALSGRLLRPGVSPAPCPAQRGLSSTGKRPPRSSSQPEQINYTLCLKSDKNRCIIFLTKRIRKEQTCRKAAAQSHGSGGCRPPECRRSLTLAFFIQRQ